MKVLRVLLIGAAAVMVLLAVVALVAFNTSFQTWVVRRALAARPGWHTTVGSVSAGWRHVTLKDVRVADRGAVLTIPEVQAELPLLAAAFSDRVSVTRLVAKGWILDLSRAGVLAANSAPVQPPVNSPAVVTTTAPATVTTAGRDRATPAGFSGVLPQLDLPVDFALDGVELAGRVTSAEGASEVTITGGGVAADKTGKFDVTIATALRGGPVETISLRGNVSAAMATPRTFSRLAVTFDALATGAKFPQPVKLSSELSAQRGDSDGEKYLVTIASPERSLLRLDAELPGVAQPVTGAWKLDARDTDVAAFALGRALPTFNAAGEGKFEANTAVAHVHAVGRIDGAADHLETLRPELAGIGQIKVRADFDVAQHEDTLAVAKLDAAIAGAQPIATVRALQEFEFSPKTGTVVAHDSGVDLIGIVLHGVPLAWSKPLAPAVAVTGGDLRGELNVSPRGGGLSFKTKTPLVADGVSVAFDGKSIVRDVDVSLNTAGDYTPKGWQVEVSQATLRNAGITLLTLGLKAGQLVATEAVKATGRLTVDLATVVRQPFAEGKLTLTRGDLAVDFTASLAADQQLQAKLALTNLGVPADGQGKVVALPTISAEVRADLEKSGRITLNAPIVLQRAGRTSDLTLVGTLTNVAARRTIEAHVTSEAFVVDDAKVLAVLLPPSSPTAGRPEPSAPSAPPWAGLEGSVSLRLKKVVYSDAFQVGNVTGTLRVSGGTLRMEDVQAGIGDGAAKIDGAIAWQEQAPQPYALAADLALSDVDPAPLFRALNPKQPPTVEGKFTVASKLVGRAKSLEALPAAAHGAFDLTSKAGIFRGLPVNVTNLVENSGKLAGWIASAGSAITSIAGKKDSEEIASKAQAVGELAKGLYPIPYDQLHVSVVRDAALNTTLKDFTLISPELRLTGFGHALHAPGRSIFDDALAMEFKLRARGHTADLLKYLGVLDPQVDDLGYAGCTVPLRVAGTLGKPDTAEVNGRLTALALEKSGVTEKAAELLNKLMGGGSK